MVYGFYKDVNGNEHMIENEILVLNMSIDVYFELLRLYPD